MPDLADLIVLVFALGLGLPGLWLVGRELLGDRLRRVRVASLRCPGRWERVLWVIPWRADCWYDLTAIARDPDGKRRCPECGRRSAESRLHGARRSVVRGGLGLLLCGAAAVALKGHQIYMGGVAAAPNWVLALIPFDDKAWFERQTIQTGDPWRDQIAEELSSRNGYSLLDGLGGRMMFERVRRALVRAGEWHDAEREEARLARMRQEVIEDGLDRSSLEDALRHLAARVGLDSRIGEPPAISGISAIAPPGPPAPGDANQWISIDGVVTRLPPEIAAVAPSVIPNLGSGAGAPVTAPSAPAGWLPAWPLTVEQALDLLVDRAETTGLDWRLADDGSIVLDTLRGTPRFGAYGDQALGSLERNRRVLANLGTIAAPAAFVPTQVRAGGFVAATGTPTPAPSAISQPIPRRALAARGWVASADDFVWTPIRAVGGPASYAFVAPRGSGSHLGIGGMLLFQGTWTQHRRLRQIWEALEAGPAAQPADREATLAALARLDAPGPISTQAIDTPEQGLAIIEQERGVRVTLDPALARRTFEDPGADIAMISVVRSALAWSPIARHLMVVRGDRALLTTARTRDLLAVPRMYRVRVPIERVSDRPRSRQDQVWPATLAARASRLAGDFPILWEDHDPPGTYRFLARTTDDEHAMLTWVLEQAERTLATGQASPPSARDGHPVAVYDLTALLSIDQVRQRAVGGGQPDGAVAALERWLGRPLDGQDTPTGRPWVRTVGPIAILRMSATDHARVRAAAEEARGMVGASADAPGSPSP